MDKRQCVVLWLVSGHWCTPFVRSIRGYRTELEVKDGRAPEGASSRVKAYFARVGAEAPERAFRLRLADGPGLGPARVPPPCLSGSSPEGFGGTNDRVPRGWKVARGCFSEVSQPGPAQVTATPPPPKRSGQGLLYTQVLSVTKQSIMFR